jgi:hypothetical protein
LEIARVFLEYGVDATARDKDGRTMLHRASFEGHVKVVRLLLEHDVDAMAQDKNGWTPLHHASRQGHLEVVRVLLECGADATAPNTGGWTPLNFAYQKGHREVLRILFDHEEGVTALGSAIEGEPKFPTRIEERASDKVQVSDFQMVRRLCLGSSSKVFLVHHKSTSNLYALKEVAKRHGVPANQELPYALTEQPMRHRMLAESVDPFVIKLRWSFHDICNLFLVMVRMIHTFDFFPGIWHRHVS